MLEMMAPLSLRASCVLRMSLEDWHFWIGIQDDESWQEEPKTRVAMCFTRDQALDVLANMLEKFNSSELYQLGPYHELLLHSALWLFFTTTPDEPDAFIDTVSTFPEESSDKEWLRVEQGRLSTLVYDVFADIYVWDDDVLMEAPDFDGLHPSAKEALGFSDGLWGVLHGLPPEIRELELHKVDPPNH